MSAKFLPIYVFVILALAIGACTRTPQPLPLCNGLPTPFDVRAECVPEGFRLSWRGQARGYVSIERTPGIPPDDIFSGWLSVGSSGDLRNETWLDDYGLEPGVRYCYRLATRTPDGVYGCFTSPIYIINDSDGSSMPHNVTAQAPSPSEIHLTWQANSTGIAAFHIERARSGPAAPEPFQHRAEVPVTGNQSGINTFSFSDTQISNAEYCYRLRAKYADGSIGCFTEPVCAMYSCSISGTPSSVTVRTPSPTEFRIEWQANGTCVDRYTIERSDAPNLASYQRLTQVQVSGTPPGTNSFSFADTQISSVEHCYRIRAEYWDGSTGNFTPPQCGVVPP